jgi:hypothetical protein
LREIAQSLRGTPSCRADARRQILFHSGIGAIFMSKTSLKNIQKQKKKARRTIDRPAQTRIQGNTAAVRKRLKKQSGLARAKKAASA